MDQCQQPYLTLLENISSNSPKPDTERTRTGINDVLLTLDTNIRALMTATKASPRGHSLQSGTIQERAIGPVVHLLGLWLDINLSLFRDADCPVLECVPEGMAAALRVVHRSDMRDLAAQLQSRLRSDRARSQLDESTADKSGELVSAFFGACLLRDLENLSYRLHRATKSKDSTEISALWELCSPIIPQLRDDEARTRVLSLFLTNIVTSISTGEAGTTSLKGTLSEIYTLLPRPTPLPIYHALLSMYAGINTSPSDANQESGHTTISSEASLANLISTWSRMREENVTPDIKAYMLLFTGLGKKGDFQALQQAWEELIRDAACKALWEKEANQCE
jgi:hypothetical protein